MGRKTKTKTEKKKNLTNSEKRIEQLYVEAIRKAREGTLLPAKQTTEEQSENDVGNKTTKRSKRPEKILEEAIRKQQELRKPERMTLSVPVSRLVPFKKETSHGFRFPRDFKKDDSTLTWVPRANTASSCGITEYDRSLWGERFPTADCGVSGIFSRPSTSADNIEEKVEQTLHILPLRSPEDGRDSPLIPTEKTKSNLPPIYRTAVWREKVIRCHGNRGSIPSRGEGWKDGGSVPLLIGKEELHNRRSMRKDTMSLAERRIALERSRRRRYPEGAGYKSETPNSC